MLSYPSLVEQSWWAPREGKPDYNGLTCEIIRSRDNAIVSRTFTIYDLEGVLMPVVTVAVAWSRRPFALG